MIKMENEKDIGRDASEVKEREGKIDRRVERRTKNPSRKRLPYQYRFLVYLCPKFIYRSIYLNFM